ncbi:hypothetical protein RJ641_019038, partial [Dillenia turbinata]
MEVNDNEKIDIGTVEIVLLLWKLLSQWAGHSDVDSY